MRRFLKHWIYDMSGHRFMRNMYDHMPYRLRRWVKKALYLLSTSSNIVPAAAPQAEVVSIIGGPLVTIVLPVYNHVEFIAESIESVLNQTYHNFELIIVDDGSEIELAHYIEPYVDNGRVTYVRQEHGGLPKALNNGFTRARGEYFTWTSADNIMGKNNIEIMLSALLSENSPGMVYSDYRLIDKSGDPLYDSDFKFLYQDRVNRSIIRPYATGERLTQVADNFIGPCFMYKRSAATVGLYNPSMGIEDYDYWIRIHTFFGVGYVNNSTSHLYQYRLHEESLTAQSKKLRILDKSKAIIKRSDDRRKQIEEVDFVFIIRNDTVAAKLDACAKAMHGVWDESYATRPNKILVTDERFPDINHAYLCKVIVLDEANSESEDLEDQGLTFVTFSKAIYVNERRINDRVYYVANEQEFIGVIKSLAASVSFDSFV